MALSHEERLELKRRINEARRQHEKIKADEHNAELARRNRANRKYLRKLVREELEKYGLVLLPDQKTIYCPTCNWEGSKYSIWVMRHNPGCPYKGSSPHGNNNQT